MLSSGVERCPGTRAQRTSGHTHAHALTKTRGQTRSPQSSKASLYAVPCLRVWFCIPSSGFRTLKKSFSLSEIQHPHLKKTRQEALKFLVRSEEISFSPQFLNCGEIRVL